MKPSNVETLIEESAELDTTYLGYRESIHGVEENIGVEDQKRVLNVLNIGPTGYGKTQLLAHSALQDIKKGRGIAVVNVKGGLIDELIAKMPKNRHRDIIYINPGRDQVTPINVLDTPVTEDMSIPQKENQKEIVVSDLIALFKRYSKNWGDLFGRVIETLLRAHLDLNIYHGEQNTLLDVFQAASDKDTLADLADRTRDNVLHEELVTFKTELTDREMEAAVRRLKDFVENKTVKRVIDAQESGVNFRKAVDQGKIILVDLQKGEIGSLPAQLIGTIAITSIWAAVQSRIHQPPHQRHPYFVYIDELQNFGQEGSNLKTIAAECREYGMGLWLASQYLNQLSPELRRSLTNNCRTKIFFNPAGSEDVSKITGMLRGVTKEELTGLGKYRAVIQQPSEGRYSDATLFNTYPPYEPLHDKETVQQVKEDATQPAETGSKTVERSTGTSGASGGEKHSQLLEEAKQYLEFEEDCQVQLLHQDGKEKPDGHIIKEDQVAHLEAEHTTLTKPKRVIQNLKRALKQDRKTVFIVEENQVNRLENILEEVNEHHYRILVHTDLGVVEP
jgi:hypothetical protein